MSTDLKLALQHRAQVEEFRRKHRTGLLTLLFTDIVGSTALKQGMGEREVASLFQDYRGLVRAQRTRFSESEEIETAGDSFLLVFARPSEAVEFALTLQTELESWSRACGIALRQRVGIHLGEVVIEEHTGPGKGKDLYGGQLDVCARVMALAGANQILMTRAVFDNARRVLKGEDVPEVGPLKWLNHGPYQFKGLEEPIEVCEVRAGIDGPVTPPTNTDKAQRVAAEGELVLGWRPAIGLEVPNTKWVLEEKLGEGGFGEVWKARHEKLDEQRVFKFCFRADRVRSLKREVTLFRLLKERIGEHPNIVRLHDIYFDQPPFYLEQEFVSGKDLKSWSEAQRGVEQVPLEMRLEIVAQAADGLQAAHDAGVIHRDVKPGNILIENPKSLPDRQAGEIRNPKLEDPQLSTINHQPSAKLSDFGIGQVLSEEYLSGITRAGFTQTMMGPGSSSQTGTQMYMAPEQFAGKPASIRSDIYALGVVLYQLLVGDFTRPVTSDWSNDITDPLLREDLAKCFAGSPQERWAGAGELARNLRTLPGRRAELERARVEQIARERAAYRRGVIRTAGFSLLIVALFSILVTVALRQSARAKAAARDLRQSLYVADMKIALQNLEEGNFGRAVQLVEKYIPGGKQEDLRGFEWRYLWQACRDDSLYTCEAHKASVFSISFSADGKLLATGSKDQTVKLWAFPSLREIRTVNAGGWVDKVALSPDGKVLASHNFPGKEIQLWETISGVRIGVLGETNRIPSLSNFSADGRLLATGDASGRVKLWEWATTRPVATFDTHSEQRVWCELSCDTKTLAVHSEEGAITLWDVPARRQFGSLPSTPPFTPIALSPDGEILATIGKDNTIKLWHVKRQEVVATLPSHLNYSVLTALAFSPLAFSPGGKVLAHAGGDNRVRLWDIASQQELVALQGHTATITGLAFSPDAKRLVSSSDDGTFKVWDAAALKVSHLFDGHYANENIDSVAFSPDSKLLAAGGTNKTVKVWDIAGRHELATLNGHRGNVIGVAFSRDGNTLASSGEDGNVIVWDVIQKRQIFTLKLGDDEWVPSVAFSPDAGFLATGGDPKRATKLWDVATRREIATLDSHKNEVMSVAFSPDGKTLATSSGDSTVKLWDVVTKREMATLTGHTDWGNVVIFSPDGRQVASASDDGTVIVWNVRTHEVATQLKVSGHGVGTVTFSQDGKTLATGGSDRMVRLWSAATGQDILTLKGHTAPVMAVAFSPDGTMLASASMDHTVRLWRAPSLAEIDAAEKAGAKAQ